MVDLLKLANCFRQWFNKSTWDTNHPLDIERFNRCLYFAIENLGTSIDKHDLEGAFCILLKEFYPEKYSENYIPEIINEKIIRAEIIIAYINDIQLIKDI